MTKRGVHAPWYAAREIDRKKKITLGLANQSLEDCHAHQKKHLSGRGKLCDGRRAQREMKSVTDEKLADPPRRGGPAARGRAFDRLKREGRKRIETKDRGIYYSLPGEREEGPPEEKRLHSLWKTKGREKR